MGEEDPSSCFADALERGDADLLARVICQWRGILAELPFDRSWLHWAVRYSAIAGHKACEEVLLKTNIVDSSSPALHLRDAAKTGLLGFMRLLIAANADLDGVQNGGHTSDSGQTPLQLAILSRKSTAAILLIDSGADVDLASDISRGTPLITASYIGLLPVVRRLLAAGVSFRPDARGDSALILAASEGHLEVVRELIKAGCDVNHFSRGLRSTLQAAAETGREDIVDLLLATGNCSSDTISSALHRSAPAPRFTIRSAEKLLQCGADVNYACAIPALRAAASAENLALMKLLLLRGADPSCVEKLCVKQKAVPEFLPTLTSLTHLHLLNPGPVPDSVYCLTKLTHLTIVECSDLTVPLELSRLSNLALLQLSNCGITHLPRYALRGLSLLRQLRLDGNQLQQLPLPPLQFAYSIEYLFDVSSLRAGVLPHGWPFKDFAAHSEHVVRAFELPLSLLELSATALIAGSWMTHRAVIPHELQEFLANELARCSWCAQLIYGKPYVVMTQGTLQRSSFSFPIHQAGLVPIVTLEYVLCSRHCYQHKLQEHSSQKTPQGRIDLRRPARLAHS